MTEFHVWTRIGIVFVFCGLCSAAQQPEPGSASNAPAPAGAPVNFNAIAILRWYPANLTASFSVGSKPLGVAFDGTSLWVVNDGDNTVTRLRASDGTLLGTFTVGANL